MNTLTLLANAGADEVVEEMGTMSSVLADVAFAAVHIVVLIIMAKYAKNIVKIFF